MSRRGAGVLRALSGLLAGGLVVLAAALWVISVVSSEASAPGPAAGTLVWHTVAAAAAVAAQWQADRDRGGRGTIAAVAVLVIAAVLLFTRWFV